MSRLSSFCPGLCDRQGLAIPQAARTSVSWVSFRRNKCSFGNTGAPSGTPSLRESGVRPSARAECGLLRKLSASFPRKAKPVRSDRDAPFGTHGAPLAERHVDDRSRPSTGAWTRSSRHRAHCFGSSTPSSLSLSRLTAQPSGWPSGLGLRAGRMVSSFGTTPANRSRSASQVVRTTRTAAHLWANCKWHNYQVCHSGLGHRPAVRT